MLEANSDKNPIVRFSENVQEETAQSQLNLVDLPRASDLFQVWNKIIIFGIDLFEGVNWGPGTSFYNATFQQASGCRLTFKQDLFIHFNKTEHIWTYLKTEKRNKYIFHHQI